MGKTAIAVLGWTMAGALLGAGAGLMFGLLFGILEGLARWDLGTIVVRGAYLTCSGAATGAILGAFGRTFDPEGFTGPQGPWANYPRDELLHRPAKNVLIPRSARDDIPANGRRAASFQPRTGRA